jgi:hypothetical protein
MLARINFPIARDRRRLCKKRLKRDADAVRFPPQLPLTTVTRAAEVLQLSQGQSHRHDPASIVPSPSTFPSSAPPIAPYDTHLTSLPVRPEPVHLSGHSSEPPSPFNSSCETLNECCAPCAQVPRLKSRMGLSKSQRIGVLLGIDTAFFLVELTVGMWQRQMQ